MDYKTIFIFNDNCMIGIPPSLKLSVTPSGCDNETFEVVLGCKRILDPTVQIKSSVIIN
jgi:hypothetical protein